MDKEECYNQRTAKHHQPLTWSLRTPGLESGDSRPVSLRGPESRNADNEIQVSFSHAGLGTNLNERFTEYREIMRSVLQRSHDSDMAGDDQISGMVTLNPPPRLPNNFLYQLSLFYLKITQVTVGIRKLKSNFKVVKEYISTDKYNGK